MNPVILIQLTENDKRILIALLLVIILVFVLIGLLGSLIVRVMRWQGRKCDTLVSDVVTYRIVKHAKQLKKYARKKNARYFIKQAWIPILIIVLGALAILIHGIVTKNWLYNPFNKDDGFGTLLFIWDFNDADSYTVVFGLKVLAKWPPLISSPHFVVNAIYSYIAIPCFIVGGIWYFIAAQAYLARTIRAHALAKKVFEKSLENFDQNSPLPTDISVNNEPKQNSNPNQ